MFEARSGLILDQINTNRRLMAEISTRVLSVATIVQTKQDQVDLKWYHSDSKRSLRYRGL